MKTTLPSRILRACLLPTAVLALLVSPVLGQASFHNMATSDYSQDFASISTWANGYASGAGASNWRVATSVPTSPGTNFTVFTSGVSGGVQRGSTSMVLLATGTNAGATDLLLDFSGRVAGSLSFDWAKVVNTASATPRTSDLKIQYSLDNGATFTDVPGYSVPRISNNEIDETGTINVQLPAALTEQSQVVIRFYFWNNGQASGSGNRPKWDIDNILVTSTSASANAPVITSPITASAVAFEFSSNIYQIAASNSPDSFGAFGLPESLTVDEVTGIISGTAPAAGTYPISITATNSEGTGSGTLTLTVLPNPGAPTITSSLQVIAPLDEPFSYQIEASNSATSFAASPLPTGWAIDTATGLITGTPTSNLSRNITISASNSLGTDTKVLNVFTGSAPTLTNPFGAAYVNVASSVSIVVRGPATSFSATGLPAGWSLDATTGVLSGTSTATGVSQFEVTAINPLGSDTAEFTLTILDQAAQNAIPLNVVVNKYLNDAPDRIQLLVIGDGTPESTVDMRGMIVKDFSGSNANDGGGKFIFTDNEVWAAVPAGTLIDLLGPGALFPEEPFIDSDNFYIAARLQDPTAFTSGGGAFDIGANDMVMIKAAGTGVSGVAGGIHVLCAGSAGAQFNAFLGAKLRSTANAAPSAVALNSTSQLSDFGVSGGAAATGVAVTVPAEELDFESWNNATNEVYIKSLRGAVDGTGFAVVRNATVGSAFSGRNLFARSSSGQSLAIDYTPTSATTPISALSIEVPVGFGTPQQVNVALAGSGAEDAVATVVGQVVSIENLTLVNPDTLSVTISGLATPNTAASVTDTGGYEFAMQSQGQDGSLAPLAAPPVARVVIPIANVRNADPETFVPVLFGQTVAVEGVCSVGRLGTGNTNSALQDATHGVTIFSQSAVPGPQTRGNRYAVVGTVAQFNGLVQLNLTDPALVFDLGSEGDPVPVTVSVTEFNDNGLVYQSRVIRIENLSYVSGTWATGENIVLQDSSGNQVTVRIQSASTATTPPASYPVTITGIAGQFDSAAPFDTGFQIQPRDQADVVSGSASAYDTWAGSFGLDPLVTSGPTAGAPTADPDGDSFSNAQEYAFGTDPIVSNGSLVTTSTADGNLTVTWLERDDVTYSPQSTTNLATTAFADDGTIDVENGPTEPAPPAGYTRKQFTVPATGNKFYRVSASVPSP